MNSTIKDYRNMSPAEEDRRMARIRKMDYPQLVQGLSSATKWGEPYLAELYRRELDARGPYRP